METRHDLEHTTERLTEGLRCPWKWGHSLPLEHHFLTEFSTLYAYFCAQFSTLTAHFESEFSTPHPTLQPILGHWFGVCSPCHELPLSLHQTEPS